MISLTGAKLVSRQFLDPCCRLSTRVTHALVSSFFSSSCEPCLKNLQGPPLPFWSEWALITSCRLAEAWPWPQSKFKWWSSTTRFKKPRHISVLQLRNQSWNRCHHAEKQTLQGRHTLDELFLLLVGLRPCLGPCTWAARSANLARQRIGILSAISDYGFLVQKAAACWSRDGGKRDERRPFGGIFLLLAFWRLRIRL